MANRPSPAAPRLHCEATLAPGAMVELPERAARHVAALRLHVGDPLVLFSGDGFESAATLTGIGKRGVTAAVGERRAIDRESPLEVRLAQGVCAGDRMDLVLQKATELGVAAIQPVVTARSVVRLSTERRERRESHWQNVVIAACEQCGRNRIPRIAPSLGFGQFIGELLGVPAVAGTRVLLAPDGEATARSLAPRGPVTVLIGPEGGLAPEEREIAVAARFVTMRFGPRVLRTETAPLAALAALQALYGDC
ncbi:MAG TPA: 16S rRNA (uracil(1498)-N(3))-methyltransferase [Burkholderiales bacterium]|nr:16S rRNA (uracil(1498)-N(3))-methyltransferase [Burkholderiales bacterium]